MGTQSASTPRFQEMESVVIRFAGDSGDGMQTIGERFTDNSALFGNDLATFPDFPAEIRAPAGTIPGVSAFQIQFGSREVLTPGDSPDALVAMNPAALKVHLEDLVLRGILVANTGAFTEANLKMAGYESNPLDNPRLKEKYDIIKMDINSFTLEALKDIEEISQKDKLRCKNFFALGFMYWIYSRPIETTIDSINAKWGIKQPALADANIRVLKAGFYFGQTTETARNRYMVAKAVVDKGVYRKISGNEGLVLGLVAGSMRAKRKLLYSGYPITPASSILEILAGYKQYGLKTVQAEDEIAAIGVAIGASYAGLLGVTGTSGPGMCLKSEFIGLATATELPLVIINVQRGGPSTGLPTKTEQSDLLQAFFGRHSDAPLPVLAACSPSDCFRTAMEAVRIALEYSTPVILLSDLYIANGAEPWHIPEIDTLPEVNVPFAPEGGDYKAFARIPDTLSRVQAIPGQAGNEHRIGGLEKDDTGFPCYDPFNHEGMTLLRSEKIKRISDSYGPVRIHGEASGDLLVLGWGGTYGSITAAVDSLQAEGYKVSNVQLQHINPFPNELGDILRSFKKVLIPELNMGQLSLIIKAQYLIDTISFTKVRGRPFKVEELRNKILEVIKD